MRLEEYVQQETNKIVQDLITSAPADLCCVCSVGCGYLVYDGQYFSYQCDHCGEHWSSQHLDIDKNKKFALLEYAD